jgi:hypothetical protein
LALGRRPLLLALLALALLLLFLGLRLGDAHGIVGPRAIGPVGGPGDRIGDAGGGQKRASKDAQSGDIHAANPMWQALRRQGLPYPDGVVLATVIMICGGAMAL